MLLVSIIDGLDKRMKSKNVAIIVHFLTNVSINTFDGFHVSSGYFIFTCLKVVVV